VENVHILEQNRFLVEKKIFLNLIWQEKEETIEGISFKLTQDPFVDFDHVLPKHTILVRLGLVRILIDGFGWGKAGLNFFGLVT